MHTRRGTSFLHTQTTTTHKHSCHGTTPTTTVSRDLVESSLQNTPLYMLFPSVAGTSIEISARGKQKLKKKQKKKWKKKLKKKKRKKKKRTKSWWRNTRISHIHVSSGPL